MTAGILRGGEHLQGLWHLEIPNTIHFLPAFISLQNGPGKLLPESCHVTHFCPHTQQANAPSWGQTVASLLGTSLQAHISRRENLISSEREGRALTKERPLGEDRFSTVTQETLKWHHQNKTKKPSA